MTAPSLSIVMPCYNEGPRIASSLRQLRSWVGPDVEILVVDDGSTDSTAERASSVAAEDARVRVHRYTPNRGKGAAFRTATQIAIGDRIVFLDADLVFDRASVLRIVEALGEADITIANRRDDQSRYCVPVSVFGFLYWRHVLGLMFNALVRRTLSIPFRDTQCGLKGFRGEVLRRIGRLLTTDGFAFDIEMLVIARTLGLRVSEIPVSLTYESARSTVEVGRGALGIIAEVVRITSRRWRGHYSRERLSALYAEVARDL